MLAQNFISDAVTIPHMDLGSGYCVQKEQATNSMFENSFSIYHHGAFVIRKHEWSDVSKFMENLKPITEIVKDATL